MRPQFSYSVSIKSIRPTGLETGVPSKGLLALTYMPINVALYQKELINYLFSSMPFNAKK